MFVNLRMQNFCFFFSMFSRFFIKINRNQCINVKYHVNTEESLGQLRMRSVDYHFTSINNCYYNT